MAPEKKFKLLRGILRTIGLSEKSTDEIVNTIVRMLAGEGKDGVDKQHLKDFPYTLQKHFLSPAELNFFKVLQTVIGDKVIICAKVSLGDLFTTKRDDYSQYTSYMNKIRRKHVDFLLCDSVTMQPLVAIELDDKSHSREDRKERDQFVDGVFKAAGLPLLHIPVKKAYVTTELSAQLMPYLASMPIETSPVTPTRQPVTPSATNTSVSTPTCPKCGAEMVLRTVRSGEKAGNKFWGCSDYPKCRSMLPYQG